MKLKENAAHQLLVSSPTILRLSKEGIADVLILVPEEVPKATVVVLNKTQKVTRIAIIIFLIVVTSTLGSLFASFSNRTTTRSLQFLVLKCQSVSSDRAQSRFRNFALRKN